MKHLKLFLVLLTLIGVNLTAKAQTWTGVSEITDGGQYYLQNATTGYFIGASSWYGTFAVASEAPTSTVTVNLIDGKYQIKFDYGGNGLFAEDENGWCYTDRNNQDHYLWNIVKDGNYFTIQLPSDDSFYVDGGYLAPTGTEVGNNIGFKQTNEYRYWKFISRDEIDAAMENATESNPVDVSILINGWDCGPGSWANSDDARKAMLNRLGFTFTGSGWKLQNSEQPNFTNYFVECWTGGALGNASATRTLTGLPSGHYKVSAYVKGGANVKMFVRDNNGTETTADTQEGDPTLVSVETNSQGELTYGFKMENTTVGWFAFDNVKLEYYYVDPLAAAKENLDKAKANVSEIVEGTVPSGIYGTLQELVASTPEEETQEAYDALISEISQAVTSAKALITPYSRYKNVKAAVKAINNDIDTSEADEMAEAATTEEALDAAVVAVRKDLTDYLETVTLNEGETINLTAALIDNATVTTRDEAIKYWNPSTQTQFNFSDNVGEFWNQSAATISQTLSNMPQGNYDLKVVALTRTSVDGGVIFANNEEKELVQVASSSINNKTQANAWFEDGNGVNTLDFFMPAAGNINIGVKTGTTDDKWTVFKSFELIYKGKVAMANADDYAALADAIETAEAKTLGFDVDEFAPYNNVVALQALAAAKAINPEVEGGNVQETVQNATAALTGAVWTANTAEVNAFYDGAFASAENNGAPAGWRMSNNTLGGSYHSRAFNPHDHLTEFNSTKSGLFLRFDGTNSNRGSMYYYGDTEGYTIPLNANTTYYVKVDFAGWGSTGKPLRMNVTGPEGFTAVSQQYNTTVNADASDNIPQQFFIVFTTGDAAGNYVVNFQTPGSDSNTHNVVISNCELFKAKPEIVTIKEGFIGTTYSSAYPLDFSAAENLTAYIITDVENGKCITEKVEKVPAGTGVYIEGDAGEYTVNWVSKDVVESVEGNLLVGTGAKSAPLMSDATTTYYLYGKQSGRENFFKVGTDKERTASAHKAYLAIETSNENSAKAMLIVGDDAVTGIDAVEKNVVEGEVYNLNGQRVNKSQKGIYIVNGKKIVLK